LGEKLLSDLTAQERLLEQRSKQEGKGDDLDSEQGIHRNRVNKLRLIGHRGIVGESRGKRKSSVGRRGGKKKAEPDYVSTLGKIELD